MRHSRGGSCPCNGRTISRFTEGRTILLRCESLEPLHDAFWPAITFPLPAGWRSSDRRRGLVIDRGETVMPSIRIIAALAALAAASTSAGAQDWPSRPLTMVYPFAAGSAADALGRMFASALSASLGQPGVLR